MSEGLWSNVREAIRGSEQNFSAIPVRRAVLLLSIPMVLEMAMESLFSIVDIFYVSALGADAVATVGLTEEVLLLVYTLAVGLASAATAIVARKVGEEDAASARSAAGQTILLALACSVAFVVLGATSSRTLLALMGASPEAIASGWMYPAIMIGGSVTIFLLFVINAIFRSAGDPALAMRTLWLANGLNIVIAPVLIFGLGPIPKLGVAGAAIATTASRAAGVVYQLTKLRTSRRITLGLRDLVPRLDVCRDLFRLAGTASVQHLIETASWLGLLLIIAPYGSAPLAGYTIAMRLSVFALMPGWGLANAAATLVGQNLGAGAQTRARHAVESIARYNLVFLGMANVCLAIAAPALVRIFTNDPDAVASGADCLRIVAFGYTAHAVGMVNIQAFNGAGDTVTPLLINLASFWVIKIPLAYVLAHVLGLGPRGIFIAITVAYAVQALLSTLFFRRGSWAKCTLPS